MKKYFTTIFLLAIFTVTNAQTWQPAGDRIKTQWAEQIDPANPLPEYPRPQLVRDQWLNLNGLWDYAILERGR
ncbi:MAG TPA: beta-galactosidase, partial [Mariniphaga anaerophila]|nr:beta-galactosidase [Mariniphaga anaerophila]